MKEILIQMAQYNVWANTKICEAVLDLPADKQTSEVVSSFSSLYKTLLHMHNAESVWWQRVKLLERIQQPAESFTGDTKELVSALLLQSRQWEEWIRNATPAALDHVFHYFNLKREQFKQPVFQVILHVFNHNTYHRGQLVTLLRQLGAAKIPQTDFVVWARKK